jgi:SAM-dependent methyltransferase
MLGSWKWAAAPVGVLGFLPARQRIAVDPLNGFYAENQKLVELRNPAVEYLTLAAEDLAFEDASFDLVIMENCIDHVQDVGSVMREIQRVLTPGGILYLTVNARSSIGYMVHRVLARAALDPGHPHTFTAGRFRRMILAYEFELLEFEEASRFQAWVDHLRSPTLRHRAKALLGVAEHLLSAVARKPG